MKLTTNIIIALALLGCSGIDDPLGPETTPTDRFGFPAPYGGEVGPRSAEIDDTAPEAPLAPGQRRAVEDSDAAFLPSSPNEFVRGVLMPGDLDGDGYGDLVFWSDVNNDPDIVDCEMGCPGFSQLGLYIAYGGPGFGDGSVIRPDAQIFSWHISGLLTHVASAGDVNGDGLADLVVSVGGRCQQGNVFELRGGARLGGVMDIRDVSSMTRETGSCTGFGSATQVGDVDGDGLGDYVVAATLPGRAYLYYGRAVATAERRSEIDADAVLVASAGSVLGLPEPAGDVDGDGFDDFLLSPPGNLTPRTRPTAAGTWRLMYGGRRLEGEVDVEALATRIEATSIRSVGDLDGDGRGELGVAGPTRAYILPGAPGRAAEIREEAGVLRIVGATTDALRGGWFRPAGDVNQDGELDFIYAVEGGSLHIFLSPIATTQAALDLDTSVTLLGRDWSGSTEGLLGGGVTAGSDLNGDGLDDLAFVAARGPYHGFVYLWLGRS